MSSSGDPEAKTTRAWRILRGVAAAAVTAAIVGVPTDVLDTTLFTRMTAVRGWEYPMLAATALLAGVWVGLPGRAGGVGGVTGSGIATALAIGCPVCNKLVVALLGVSGALGVWAPIQPMFGVGSLLALAVAVTLRWRRSRTESCPAPRNVNAATTGQPGSHSGRPPTTAFGRQSVSR